MALREATKPTLVSFTSNGRASAIEGTVYGRRWHVDADGRTRIFFEKGIVRTVDAEGQLRYDLHRLHVETGLYTRFSLNRDGQLLSVTLYDPIAKSSKSYPPDALIQGMSKETTGRDLFANYRAKTAPMSLSAVEKARRRPRSAAPERPSVRELLRLCRNARRAGDDDLVLRHAARIEALPQVCLTQGLSRPTEADRREFGRRGQTILAMAPSSTGPFSMKVVRNGRPGGEISGIVSPTQRLVLEGENLKMLSAEGHTLREWSTSELSLDGRAFSKAIEQSDAPLLDFGEAPLARVLLSIERLAAEVRLGSPSSETIERCEAWRDCSWPELGRLKAPLASIIAIARLKQGTNLEKARRAVEFVNPNSAWSTVLRAQLALQRGDPETALLLAQAAEKAEKAGSKRRRAHVARHPLASKANTPLEDRRTERQSPTNRQSTAGRAADSNKARRRLINELSRFLPDIVAQRSLLQRDAQLTDFERRTGIVGMENTVREVRQAMMNLANPGLYEAIRGRPYSGGMLIAGPAGVGKVTVVERLAADLGLGLVRLNPADLESKYIGETEKKIREIFRLAREKGPTVILLHDFDAATRSAGSDGEATRQAGLAIATWSQELSSPENAGKVLVFATTKRPEEIPSEFKRPGALGRTLDVGPPDEMGRHRLLRHFVRGMNVDPSVDLAMVAKETPGFSPADLEGLVEAAAQRVLDRTLRAGSPSLHSRQALLARLTPDDIDAARKQLTPSVMREINGRGVAKVAWDAVGGCEEAKATLMERFVDPILRPENYEGYRVPRGILLSGPPGTGKTLLGRALASIAGINFLDVSIASLRNDRPEKAVATLFERARRAKPAILFIDEVDAVASERTSDDRWGKAFVGELLRQLDGADSSDSVFLVCTTNRPDDLDKALLREGRVELRVDVGLPSESDRARIFETYRSGHWGDDVDTADLARQTEGWPGSAIASAINEGLRLRGADRAPRLTQAHLSAAIASIKRQRAAKNRDGASTRSPGFAPWGTPPTHPS
ncbi:MAG: AAA family ATPase [Deltaproteobacteria bacterium]|nr:AAA family ATPase [Deltaproteobacteria bacterium]